MYSAQIRVYDLYHHVKFCVDDDEVFLADDNLEFFKKLDEYCSFFGRVEFQHHATELAGMYFFGIRAYDYLDYIYDQILDAKKTIINKEREIKNGLLEVN